MTETDFEYRFIHAIANTIKKFIVAISNIYTINLIKEPILRMILTIPRLTLQPPLHGINQYFSFSFDFLFPFYHTGKLLISHALYLSLAVVIFIPSGIPLSPFYCIPPACPRLRPFGARRVPVGSPQRTRTTPATVTIATSRSTPASLTAVPSWCLGR